ncbi:Lysosomal Pro-X carboxypeptidase-like [Homarus americanus]|uniref:Lysosomal Pro-X carboxypeptidase-like n=1 Tax=Homarus americanus TaxID=6706 RepID=A0A8J5JRY9_HOMAM|nr:Lysosomal Pro-X carboxypeptidase-like [Homarus americanus]
MKWLVLQVILASLLLHFGYAYKYETYFYKQKVDHFSFVDPDSYSQRYLINDESWDSDGGPIFFYAGNEGDITWFAENTGFMWDIAPEFNALIIFAEHRYYGVSLPYGNKSFTEPKYSGYLTSEQALADFAELISYLRIALPGAKNSAVIAFGGSYGGMLAAWFRMKYPHVVQGSIAASAPILQFIDITPCEKFGQVVTADFARESSQCVEVIRNSWAAIDAVTADEVGMNWLTGAWKLCQPLKTQKDVQKVKEYLTDVWTNLAMVVCTHLTEPTLEPKALLEELFAGACTEMVMPMCYDGVKDFFEPSPWDFKAYATKCYESWNIYPRPLMAPMIYGGKDISAASNIVFSNGLLDPWSTGGVMWNVSDSVVSIIIPEGAHHLDLRSSNPDDPQSVIDARILEKKYISTWIESYKSENEI